MSYYDSEDFEDQLDYVYGNFFVGFLSIGFPADAHREEIDRFIEEKDTPGLMKFLKDTFDPEKIDLLEELLNNDKMCGTEWDGEAGFYFSTKDFKTANQYEMEPALAIFSDDEIIERLNENSSLFPV